jgi:hypothetical protein
MLEDLFRKWNKKMGGTFYLFYFKVEGSFRWQIGEKDRIVTLSDLYGAPYIVGGVNLNASYSRDCLTTILKANI